MIYAYFTLFVALVISSIAEYYSIVGLTAIFSAAFWPIVIMGASLGVGKITAALWLKINWARSPLIYKIYLVPAVASLMFLTSIGCFGFLSKAHSDQNLVSGDVTSKIAIYDEKIKTEKENIEANRKALKQMDEGVDQVLGRSTDEKGADKAVAMRKSQQKERGRLQTEILQSQKSIQELNDARAPIAAEVRKVEAEVGPIKYIAALIYGDNPSSDILEKAVRFVIIIIVAVFDPLALVLILAAQQSIRWAKEDQEKKEEAEEDTLPVPHEPEPVYEADEGPLTEEQVEQLKKSVMAFTDFGEHPKDDLQYIEPEPEPVVEKSILEQHPYLTAGFSHFQGTTPMVYKPEAPVEEPVEELTVDSEATVDVETTADNTILAAGIDIVDRPGDYVSSTEEIVTYGVTKEDNGGLQTIDGDNDYVILDGRHMRVDAAKAFRPDLFRIQADDGNQPRSDFGTTFPTLSKKGDTFVRVDVLPNRVFKFDGTRWIEVNKEQSGSYLHNEEYIKHLVSMIESGQYDIELLSDNEKAEIEQYLNQQNG